jgi:hypothetical protein
MHFFLYGFSVRLVADLLGMGWDHQHFGDGMVHGRVTPCFVCTVPVRGPTPTLDTC